MKNPQFLELYLNLNLKQKQDLEGIWLPLITIPTKTKPKF